MARFRPALFVFGLATVLCARAEEKVDFNYDIRPIISTKCFHCHGPDEKARDAKLRLDVRAEALKERDGIRAIVPGDPAASDVVERITSDDRDEVMPPPKESHPLTAREVELIKRWIAQGAEYKEHWSFVKPVRPAVPEIGAGEAPEDGGWRIDDWRRNPIDAFILQQLARAGLQPSPPADLHTICRRLYLDLTGLPPTPQETRAFFDSASTNRESAISALTDRLLAAPAYGERWAKMWLDLARYADSTGYGSDKFRLNIWPYRDWVIDAFNRNLPYDQFTIEQLAGDLLPSPTPEQLAATAFHRNTMTNVEGGTIDEEYRVAAVKDRIATTGQVWMGLTVGCAQCHTHKFDPITQKDYYQFFGVFNQTEDSDREDEAPTKPMPTAAEQQKIDLLTGEIAQLDQKLGGSWPELETELHEWEAQIAEPVAWTALQPIEVTGASETNLELLPDGFSIPANERRTKDTYSVVVRGGRQSLTAFRFELQPSLPGTSTSTPAKESADFTLHQFAVSVRPPGATVPAGRYVRIEQSPRKFIHLAEVQVFAGGKNIARTGKATQSSTYSDATADRAIDGNSNGNYRKNSVQHTADGDEAPWWEVDLGELQPIEKIKLWNRTDEGVGSRIAGATLIVLDAERHPVWKQVLEDFPKEKEVLPTGEKQIALRNASDNGSLSGGASAAIATASPGATGWSFIASEPSHVAAFETAEPLTVPEESTLLIRITQSRPSYLAARIHVSATSKPPPVRELPPVIKTILALEPSERDLQQRVELLNYFRPQSAQFAALQKLRDAKVAERAAIKPVALPILRELAADKRRETHIMNKGNYLTPGEQVEPGLLAHFAAFMPAPSPATRLDAARWIVHPDNPLTARVAVNRFWSQLFGTGLVESEEDFGSQGSLPSHPELLDWLAVTFQSPKTGATDSQPALGWDMKALLKLLVTSATYQQSSKVSPVHLEKDTRNRLLAHFPRRRLDAETVRDQALAVSGLLSTKIGGPSVYPPQPDGLWKVAFNGAQNGYPTSKGEDRYRRGLYTFWRRTMPYPSMTTFDAPSRETCTVRRIPTNTPLQSFVTMNDPVYVECAQALARRMVRDGGADVGSRVRFGLEVCLARPATEAQITALTALFNDELAHAREDITDATKLATEPLGTLPSGADPAELAAFTVVANVLLNLDALLTKS